MKKFYNFSKYFLAATFLTAIAPQPAMAYVGPGAGLVSIAAFIAFAVAVLAALLGFLWFPLKRLLSARNNVAVANEPQVKTSEEM